MLTALGLETWMSNFQLPYAETTIAGQKLAMTVKFEPNEEEGIITLFHVHFGDKMIYLGANVIEAVGRFNRALVAPHLGDPMADMSAEAQAQPR